MNSCQHSENVLDYLLGTLDHETQEKFEKHLKDCPVCQKEVKIETMVEANLSKSYTPVSVADIVIERLRILRAIHPQPTILYTLRMVAYALTAVVFAIVLLPMILDTILSINMGIVLMFGPLSSKFPILAAGCGVLLTGISTLFSLQILKQ